MAVRVLAGLALWLALAALPVFHVGPSVPLVAFALVPIPLLAFRTTSVLFLLSFLPLSAVRPELFSPRVHGEVGILGVASLLACYLVLSLRDTALPRPRHAVPGHRRGASTVLVVAAATMGAAAVALPYVAPVAAALRVGYPAGPGAASVLLAVLLLALTAGLVLTYLAAPLDEAARERS